MTTVPPEQPTNWELSRSITRIESSIMGMGTRLEAKIDGLPSKSDHEALKDRVKTLEGSAEKRLDRVFSIWLGVGLAILAAFGSLVVVLVTR